jgi:hypothetical protein
MGDDDSYAVTVAKKFLGAENEPKENLKLYLLMRHGTIARAGQVAGVTADRVHQILCGLDVPESPDTIKRFSEAWDVDIVVLTKLFERLR